MSSPIPTVSVVIPAYNAAASLPRALRSVLDQTLTDFEIIVIDDASTDGTAAAASAQAALDPRITVLTQPSNRGVSAARNAGLAAARGDWIAILDADDAFLPERLETLVAVGATHAAEIVADDILYYDWHEREVVGSGIGRDDGSTERVTAAVLFANALPGRSPFEFSLLKVLFRRDFLRTHDIRYIEGLRQGEDFMIYARAILSGAKMVLLHRAFYVYTESTGRKSRKASQLSRTIENCDEMRRQTLTLLDDPVVRADPGLVSLLAKRADAIDWYESWEKVYQPLRQRRFLSALKVASTDWRAGALLARELARRVVRTLTPKAERGAGDAAVVTPANRR